MPAELALVDPPSLLWRVERVDPALRFSRINAVDAAQDRAGNRFDVPGAGVLYGATQPQGAYAETLAGFRPSATLAARLASIGEAVPSGEIPVSWRPARRLRSFTPVDALPFVDIEAPSSHTYLTQHAADVLLANGMQQLDVAAVRGPSRRLTRGLASWLYSRTDEHGAARYGGIRYISRLGDHECWAIFDGTDVRLINDLSIAATDTALCEIASIFALHIQ